ncbi:MAG TPA: hypothetical protein VKT80_16825, partial [Chloroflexota bacterium]|nr:hypothetical protein [Chloroflexota bacterium]
TWSTSRFDVPSWIEAGARTEDFLRAAEVERLGSYLRAHGTENILGQLGEGKVGRGLIAEYRGLDAKDGVLHPAAVRDIENLLAFYGHQFFTERAEGADQEESFKSLISKTEIGRFIEGARAAHCQTVTDGRRP